MDGHTGEQDFDNFSHAQPLQFNNYEHENSATYYPPEQAGWMNQMQHIPLENFPHAPGPLIYEGYVPSSGPDSSYQFDYQHNPVFPLYGNQTPSASEPTLASDTHLDRDVAASEQASVANKAPRTRKSTRSLRRGTSRPPPQPRPERKRGRKKGEKRGPREVLDPGDEFNALHAQATEAFLDKQDHETALQCILQAISINPEIYSAHVLLSEIYFSQGESDKAFAALFSGAHAAPNDPNVWHQLADACLQKSAEDRETALQQASYCFSRILNIDQKDFDARFQKAAISKELGYYAKALKDLDALLKAMPHNSSVLGQIAEVCTDLGDVTKARVLYEDALEAQRSARVDNVNAFDWNDLIIYVDLVAFADGTVEAIKVLKEISREFVGRADEYFWNSIIEDDREWDAHHEPRRVKITNFHSNRYPLESYGTALPLDMRVKLGNLRLTEGSKEEALMHFAWLEPEATGEGAPVYEFPDLFLQTADSLRTSKDFRQALRYYDALNNINAYDDVEFWLGIGSCAYVCGQKQDAVAFFENAKSADPQNPEAFIQLSKLYSDNKDRTKAVKNAREALVIYENAIGKGTKRKYERKETREAREDAQAVYRKAYMLTPPPGESRMKMTAPSFSRRVRERKRRRRLVENSEQEQDTVATQRDRYERVSRLARRRLSKPQRTQEQQETSIRQMYTTLDSHTQAMRQGDEEARSVWLECAESLIEEFRSKKSFYPAERYKKFQGYEPAMTSKKGRAESNSNDTAAFENQEDYPIPSIESAVPDDYCGISFASWLDIFLEYALLLANLQYEPSECYTVITAAQDCTIWYHNPDAMAQIYTCYVVCALALHDETTLFSTALRWFMREYAFCSDVYRLFSALNFYYPHSPDKAGKLGQVANAKFRIAPNQKFLFRHLVSLDSQLPEEYGLDTIYGPVPAFMRKERWEAGAGYLRAQDTTNETPMGHGGAAHSQADSPFNSVSTPLPEQHDANSSGSNRPVEMEIHLLMVYGQILYASGSFPNALSYFYRAMSLDPANPVLLLNMALCYLHQMLKRQCDNRHMYFLQGLALFDRYAELRISWAEKKEMQQGTADGLVDIVRREIEFNRARCWQMVGMADLAIRGYEKMMNLRPVKREDKDEGDLMDVDEKTNTDVYSMEAAYSIALMYATNGDMKTAKEVTEKWLVVE